MNSNRFSVQRSFKQPNYFFRLTMMVSLGLMLSCKDKDADETQPVIPKPACQLNSVVTGLNERIYEYDDEGQLIKFIGSYNNYIKYEYNDGRAAKLTYYRDNDESQINEIDRIEYNSKGQWIKHTYELDDQEAIAEYDGNGNRIMITLKENDKLTEIYTFEYSSGDLVKQTIDHYDIHESLSYSSYYTYSYDLTKENKLVYFETLVRFGYTETTLGMESTPATHMLKTVNTISSDGSTVSTSANYDYEFNEKGFPTELTISGGDLNGDGQITGDDILLYSYEYSCL